MTVTPHTLQKITATLLLTSSLALTSCATNSLLDDAGSRTYTQKKKLFDDQVVAFAKPAQAMPNIPANSVVIVGNKHSYIMYKGSEQFLNLMTKLDRRNFNVERKLKFVSDNNDGKFEGTINLSYVKLKTDLTDDDMRFFLQNGGSDCTKDGDKRMKAQRVCFAIDIEGGVYPRVNNYEAIRSGYNLLSKAYTVSMYTQVTKTENYNDKNIAEKIVLLPFALAFDVITLPLQALEGLD